MNVTKASDQSDDRPLLDIDSDMRAMSVETGQGRDGAEPIPQSSPWSWLGGPSFSSHSYADLVSYFGFRGVVIIIFLKIVAVIAFAAFFMSPSPSQLGDYSTVGLVTGRPDNVRDMVRRASESAAFANPRALYTLLTQNDLIYDEYIEFILSFPVSIKQSANGVEAGDSESGSAWQDQKDSTSTLSKYSTTEEIATERKASASGGDPLDVHSINDALIVHRFAEDAGAGGSGVTQPYSIVLNKFNTVKDHCLIVTDAFEPQVAPLTAADLELWHWVLLQTRGAGFYNSNLMAGASQAHKHMQFIPGDAIWSMRNPDATHALPIDDVIMPRIESGRWRPYPAHVHHSSSSAGSGKEGPLYATSLEAKQRFQAALLHQIPQFDFQHAVAVLLDRSAFVQEPRPLQAYSEYLRSVYEALLLVNGVSLSDLQACAYPEDSGASTSTSTSSQRRVLQDTDDLISEGNVDKALHGHKDKTQQGEKPQPVKRTVDCVKDVGYNLILRPQYLLLVPRGQKNFASAVNINSFGFMGLFLATKESSRQLIKDVGPLEILKSVGKELTVRCGYFR